MNIFKTALLMTALTALFLLVGRLLGGTAGMQMAFVFALLTNVGSYWFSDKLVLAMSNAKPIGEAEAPVLARIVQRLAQKANIPMPKLYIIESPVPNAFATGRNPQHAAVAATTGILSVLDERELEGVLGHELSHIFHRDILISTIAATVAGAVMMLAHMARWGMMVGGFGGRDRENRGGGLEMLAIVLFAPLAASLIQLAISRSREYHADLGGANLTGDPLALAAALEKISAGNARAATPLSSNPVVAHLYIANPLRADAMMSLFSTHPPIAERIKRLQQMAREQPPMLTRVV